jgi:hypothetical protein
MFGEKTVKYYLMLKNNQVFDVLEHVDLYAFFRIPALKNAYRLSNRDTRLKVIEGLYSMAYDQTPEEMEKFATVKMMFALQGQAGVDKLYAKKFLQLMDTGKFSVTIFEVLLNFKARSGPFKAAYDAASKETRTATLRYLATKLEQNRFNWDSFFDTAEVLSLLGDEETRADLLVIQYETLSEQGQAATVLNDVAKAHDARLPLLYEALENVSESAFDAVLTEAHHLTQADSAAARVMAGNLLRKYTP